MDMSSAGGHQLLRHGLHFHNKDRSNKQKQNAEEDFKQPIPNHRLFGNVGPWAIMDFSKDNKDPVKLF